MIAVSNEKYIHCGEDLRACRGASRHHPGARRCYISISDTGAQIAELKRVTDATDKVILADRDFTALRLRVSDYIGGGLEEDGKQARGYAISTDKSLSEAVAMIKTPNILSMAQQVLIRSRGSAPPPSVC